ncbi:DNA ligase (ATP) [Ranunculus cassubicifolius]
MSEENSNLTRNEEGLMTPSEEIYTEFEICKESDDSRKDETLVPEKPTITRRELYMLLNKPLPEEFKCEICGNFRYRDRNGFERHFRLARHTYGMRYLGIPNSLMFKGVTSIEAARDRWGKIQAYRILTNWKQQICADRA